MGRDRRSIEESQTLKLALAYDIDVAESSDYGTEENIEPVSHIPY
jgi:hypothetical protein